MHGLFAAIPPDNRTPLRNNRCGLTEETMAKKTTRTAARKATGALARKPARTLPRTLKQRADAKTVSITPVRSGTEFPVREQRHRIWLAEIGFSGRPGETALLPAADGRLARVLLGTEAGPDLWSWSAAAAALPPGRYRITSRLNAAAATHAALGWALADAPTYPDAGASGSSRSRARPAGAELVLPAGADAGEVVQTARAFALVRRLISAPASALGPAELAAEARAVARRHRARIQVTVGDDLLRRNYPMVHAVGRASSRMPRLIDLTWGRAGDPLVAIIGKGVCFDSGGLDLKAAAGMQMMKKDMGGAAMALGLAQMVMEAELRIRLRVLIPAVENSVSGNAMRPLDVLESRSGRKVEVGNTDAEGRLVMADALTAAAAAKPAMIFDFATLTGAARIALGPDLPAMFCNDDALASALARTGERIGDPVWRMPLWDPYRRFMKSHAGDLSSTGNTPFAGAVTAALFLETFVDGAAPWAHFDVYGWNPTARPGRPEGGEAMAIRTVFSVLAERFGGR